MTREAEERAKRAESSAKQARNWVRTIGITGLVAIVIALVGLGQAFYSNIQSAYNAVGSQITVLQNSTAELYSLKSQVEGLTDENRALQERLRRLESDAK